jgi:hypothetical protein
MTPEARTSVELRRSPRRQGVGDSLSHLKCAPGLAPSTFFMLNITADRCGLVSGTEPGKLAPSTARESRRAFILNQDEFKSGAGTGSLIPTR